MGSRDFLPLPTSEDKSGRYISLSVLIHAAMVASVTWMGVPSTPLTPKDVVEFEVDSDVLGATPIPDGLDVPESMGASSPSSPSSLPSSPSSPSSTAPISRPAVQTPPSPPSPPPAASTVPPRLDDIPIPTLESAPVETEPVAALEEKDLQESFDKVDLSHQQAVALEKESFEKDVEDAKSAHEEALAQAEKENQEREKSAAAALEARKVRQAQEKAEREKAAAQAAALAQAQAEAEAKAKAAEAAASKQAEEKERLAREQAEAQEQAAAAATAAAAQAQTQSSALSSQETQGSGTGDSGQGTGDSGSPQPTLEVAGIPDGVRALDQLRQMPGNKFPQYSKEERLARQEGKAVFYAYVNRDGSLSQFKLGQSTGYRNLDLKTLAALKKWKFYPGQEGWVEMPFQWVLRGETREAGGQLRK